MNRKALYTALSVVWLKAFWLEPRNYNLLSPFSEVENKIPHTLRNYFNLFAESYRICWEN